MQITLGQLILAVIVIVVVASLRDRRGTSSRPRISQMPTGQDIVVPESTNVGWSPPKERGRPPWVRVGWASAALWVVVGLALAFLSDRAGQPTASGWLALLSGPAAFLIVGRLDKLRGRGNWIRAEFSPSASWCSSFPSRSSFGSWSSTAKPWAPGRDGSADRAVFVKAAVNV